MRKGVLAAAVAYTLWGILPVYWTAIQTVPALEILCHRLVWSLALLALLLAVRRQWAWLRQVHKRPRLLLTSLGSASLLGVNWLTYIWAVNAGHVVDSSLGYFINPLVSVLLGVLFLRERLRPWQIIAMGLAALGVLLFTLGLGAFPWIAFTLAGTFGFYGLLRKTAPLGSLEGFSLEMAALFPPALAYLVHLESAGTASFAHAGTVTSLLLALTGVVTTVPFLLFASAARRVTLATVGIMQYIAPTLQFLLGVFFYREPVSPARLVGFAAIWLALLLYSAEGFLEERRRRARPLSGGLVDAALAHQRQVDS
jgi:chloramphenicol-sensitive protein RarD